MANFNLRRLDALTLSGLKAVARHRKVSVNRLIVETLRRQYAPVNQTFDDLDFLAGTWSQAQAAEFEAAIAPFAQIDATLWPAKTITKIL